LHYCLSIDFLDAVNGATKRLTLPDGGSLDVTISAGLQEGQILRLRGKGAPSLGEGKAGDALVEISINPHRFFARQGDDILVDLPASQRPSGGSHPVPTPSRPVMLSVPKGSNTGAVLRLKGRRSRRGGRGDELVGLKVMLPTEPNPELRPSSPAGRQERATTTPICSHDHQQQNFLIARNSIAKRGSLDRGGVLVPSEQHLRWRFPRRTWRELIEISCRTWVY
jgi:DnaJ-class molecular chaperone